MLKKLFFVCWSFYLFALSVFFVLFFFIPLRDKSSKKYLRYKSLNLFENRLLIEGRLGKKISTWQATRTGFVFTTEMFLLQ